MHQAPPRAGARRSGATIPRSGKTATGIEVPDEIVTALREGRA